MNKYRAVKVELDGHKFDSKKEAARYQELKLLETAGEISQLRLQPAYKLIIAGIPICYDNGRQAVYRGDFEYVRNGMIIIEDVKGVRTDVYKLKRAIMRAMDRIIVEV